MSLGYDIVSQTFIHCCKICNLKDANSSQVSTEGTLLRNKLTNCKHCQQELTFDDQHVSRKSGKKIPLDAQSGEPHRCEESLDAWRANHPLKCRLCDQEIFFDSEITSANGKKIPLDVETEEPHDCPKSTYRGRKR